MSLYLIKSTKNETYVIQFMDSSFFIPAALLLAAVGVVVWQVQRTQSTVLQVQMYTDSTEDGGADSMNKHISLEESMWETKGPVTELFTREQQHDY